MWNERYDTDGYVFGTAPSQFLTKHAGVLPVQGSALAVADGEGRNSCWLAAQGLSVTAYDFAPNGVAKARKLAAAQGVSVDFQVGDILTWDWAAKRYDVLAAVFFQFLSPDQRAEVFEGFKTALKPGGILLLHGYAPRQIDYGTGGPPWVDNLYTLPMLRDLFTGYEILHEEDYDLELEEGDAHKGMSALIDFVIRKPE